MVTKSARVPEVMYSFEPLITYSSPSRRAVVRMFATSEPPLGSVIARDPMIRPSSAGRANRSMRSVSPDETMCGGVAMRG